MNNHLVPKLLVADARAAITFYTEALGAEVRLRVADDHGVVNHAELMLDAGVFALAQSVEQWGWSDPRSLGGSPVLLELTVTDPDAGGAPRGGPPPPRGGAPPHTPPPPPPPPGAGPPGGR
ncbi:VOC family protein, partial [Nocardia salmonicida]|uniref:VOC family protein n=1 Tax=Nocardia salmonicida TaxID=53431 RepID=UPI0037A7580D